MAGPSADDLDAILGGGGAGGTTLGGPPDLGDIDAILGASAAPPAAAPIPPPPGPPDDGRSWSELSPEEKTALMSGMRQEEVATKRGIVEQRKKDNPLTPANVGKGLVQTVGEVAGAPAELLSKAVQVPTAAMGINEGKGVTSGAVVKGAIKYGPGLMATGMMKALEAVGEKLPEGKAKQFSQVTPAVLDELETQAGNMGADPLTYLLPAKRAVGLFFLPGMIKNASEEFPEAYKLYREAGDKVTPEVAREVVRGVFSAGMAGLIGAHMAGGKGEAKGAVEGKVAEEGRPPGPPEMPQEPLGPPPGPETRPTDAALKVGEAPKPAAPPVESIDAVLQEHGVAPAEVPQEARGADRRNPTELAAPPGMDRRVEQRRQAASELGLPEEHPAVERVLAAEEKAQLADLDELTGVGNNSAYQRAVRGKKPSSVSEIDIAGIGSVNKQYGEHYSDARLAAAGMALKDLVGADGEIFRKGGDEFVVHWKDEAAGKMRHPELASALNDAEVVVRGSDGEIKAAWKGVEHYDGYGEGKAAFEDASAQLYGKKPKAGELGHKGEPGERALPAGFAEKVAGGRELGRGDLAEPPGPPVGAVGEGGLGAAEAPQAAEVAGREFRAPVPASRSGAPERGGEVAAAAGAVPGAEPGGRGAGALPAEEVAPAASSSRTAGALALQPEASRAEGPPGPPEEGVPGGGGPPPGARGEKYAASVNMWQRAETPEALNDVVRETARQMPELMEKSSRGKMTVEETDSLAGKLGISRDKVLDLKVGKGKAYNAEELRALTHVLDESAGRVVESAKKAREKVTPESTAALMEELAHHAKIQAIVNGSRAEAGRALGTLNFLKNREATKGLAKLIEEKGGEENIKLIADALADMDPNAPLDIGNFARRILKASKRDMVYEAWINFILSGPPTHSANILSNAITALSAPLEKSLAGVADAGHYGASRLPGVGKLYGKPTQRSVFFGEGTEAALSLRQGISEGVRAGLQAWKTERAQFGESKTGEAGGESGRPDHAIPGKVGKLIRTPTRALMAMDEFFKGVVYRMSVNSHAFRTARVEGLRGRAAIERAAELVASPPDSLRGAAEQEALYRTFNNDPGQLTKSMMRLRREHPGIGWIIPFIRTPVNVVKYGLDRSPLKVLTFGKAMADYRAGKIKMSELSTETAKTMIGISVAMGVAELTARGLITGSGPTDQAQKKTWEATGKQPYSIKIGDQWLSYARLEPLGVTLGMTADFMDIAQRGLSADRVPAAVLASIKAKLFDATWISGITGVMKAADDYQRYGQAYALRTLASAVPNLFTYAARAIDDTRRQPATVGQAFKAKIPGLSKDVPAARDIFGEAVRDERSAPERFLSPIARSRADKDPLAAELVRLGISVAPPSKEPPLLPKQPGQPQKKAELDEAELDALRTARGKAMKEALEPIVGSPQYRAMAADQEQQKEMLRRVIAQAHMRVNQIARGLKAAGRKITLDELMGRPPGPPS